jgi:hypothetical protein
MLQIDEENEDYSFAMRFLTDPEMLFFKFPHLRDMDNTKIVFLFIQISVFFIRIYPNF